MKEFSLKLYEIFNLEGELNGFTSTDKKSKLTRGLLAQEISFGVKYQLLDFYENTIQKEKQKIDSLTDQLVMKYGEQDDFGGFSLLPTIKKVETDAEGNEVERIIENPKYKEFDKEYQELMGQEKKISVPTFKLMVFERVETSETYPVFSKYLIEKE